MGPPGTLGGRVLGDVREGRVVGGPGHVPDPGGRVGQQFPGSQILDVQSELAGADRVDRVGEQVAVVADDEGPPIQGVVPPGQGVQVEEDFLRGVRRGAPPADVDRIRPPLLGSRRVEVAAQPIGHLDVGLLEPGDLLEVERLAEGLDGLQDGVRVGILRFEVGDDLAVRLVAEPVVVVPTRLAVDGGDLRDRLGRRGHRRPGVDLPGGRPPHAINYEERDDEQRLHPTPSSWIGHSDRPRRSCGSPACRSHERHRVFSDAPTPRTTVKGF